jgi:hypothetical protein
MDQSNDALKEYLSESSQKYRSSMKEHFIFNKVPIFIQDDLFFLDNESNIKDVINIIEKSIPPSIGLLIDVVYIGDFMEFEKRETNAAYKDGAIYVINVHDNAKDMADDIIHEIAHAVEDKYPDVIYGDGEVQREFLGKRERLYQILKSYGEPLVNKEYFDNPDFYPEFDMYLYKTLGYKKLQSYINGLFYSPYAATSIHEYFARGFEAYFLHKHLKQLASVSPMLYNKVELLADME